MQQEISKALKHLVSSVEKRLGKGAIMALGDADPDESIRVVSTGSLALNQALGVGGYPCGRIVEVFGPEASGKTTLSLHAIAEAQRAGGIAAFIDAEHAFDPTYARAIGVRLDELLLSQPDSGEQALEIVDLLTRSEAVDLIVVDSVAALTPQAEIDGAMGDIHVGLQARLMSQALRKLTSLCHRTDTTLMFINQLRHKIGVTFGSPETTTGGNALKFYASVRLDVRRIGQIKTGDQAVGSKTRVKVAKNKCAPPFRAAEFEIRWGVGIDAATDLLDRALNLGLVDKSGSHLSFGDRKLGQGREKAREAILSTGEIAEAMRSAIDTATSPSAAAA